MNNTVSLVTSFKRFDGAYDRIQQAALYSYAANDLFVVVPSNEINVKEKCRKYGNVTVIDGVKHARDLGFNNQSSILKDLMKKALPLINTPMAAFVKSDVILTEDFSSRCSDLFKKHGLDTVMAGSRQNIQLLYNVDDSISYKRVHQEKRVQLGNLDFFVTSKFIWRKILANMPEFIIGRYYLDGWLLGEAQNQCLKCFNISDSLTLLHCDHNHSHIRIFEKADGENAPSSKYNHDLWTATGKIHSDLKTWNIG